MNIHHYNLLKINKFLKLEIFVIIVYRNKKNNLRIDCLGRGKCLKHACYIPADDHLSDETPSTNKKVLCHVKNLQKKIN